MEKRVRSCENCRHYKIYYTKGICKFEAQKIGFCALFEKNLDKYEVCTAWTSDEALRKVGKKVAQARLDDLLAQTAQVRQILEESNE